MRIKKSILIVEDDELVSGTFQCVLEEEGHVVLCCHNGSDALMLAKVQNFDVIMADYNLQDIKGDELCRLLRLDHPNIFIIGCSGENHDKAFLSAGADTFIMKDQLIQDIALLMKSITTG